MDISGQPPTYDAYKEFADGEDAFFRVDWTRAIEHYLRAGELDPSFKRPSAAGCLAYCNLRQYAAGEKLIDELEKVRDVTQPTRSTFI